MKLLGPYQTWTHAIAFDYGKEFAEHERVAEAYFACPHAFWEQGLMRISTAC